MNEYRGMLELMKSGAQDLPSPGPWRVGKIKSTVVCDSHICGLIGANARDYYGGNLIGESVAPNNVRLIAAAPALLEYFLESMAMIHDMASSPDMKQIVDSFVIAATKVKIHVDAIFSDREFPGA